MRSRYEFHSMRARGLLALVFLLASAPAALAQRTELEPGWNMFSPQQDIEMGREVAREAERELALVDDRSLNEYLNRLGQQLASVAPGEKYPYQFKWVNDSSVNAFALPGGFIYIHRGILERADREAELAGVMAHEIAHVALRHGTNQASKAYLAQAPLAILGGVFGGGNGVGSILTQLGIGFGANSLFMKFSRDAERQADLMGAQILYDAGYDPTGMAEFFEKLASEGRAGAEFFSSHPNPGNRRQAVAEEIQRLGPARSSYRNNASDFRRVKDRFGGIPEASERGAGRAADNRPSRRPDAPSSRLERYRGDRIQLDHPANWNVMEDVDSVTFAPEGGTLGNGALGYGLIVSTFEPNRGRLTLEAATDDLIASLRRSNPSMRVREGYRNGRLGGRTALFTTLASDSPFGGEERDRLITAFGADGRLYYFIAVAPEAEMGAYQGTFEAIFRTVRFR